MSTRTHFPALRLCALSLAAALALGLGACSATGPMYTPRAVSKPAQALKGVQLVFIENELRAPGLAVANQRNEKLEGYGYYELGRLIKERAPALLAANGLSGDVRVLAQPKAGEAVNVSDVGPGDAILMLRVSGGQEVRKGPLSHKAYLQMGATLMDAAAGAGARKTLWTSQVSFQLGWDDAMGALAIRRVDAEFVDTLVIGLLNNMAREGMIALPQEHAVRPKAS